MAPQQSACLVCTRLWVQSPELEKERIIHNHRKSSNALKKKNAHMRAVPFMGACLQTSSHYKEARGLFKYSMLFLSFPSSCIHGMRVCIRACMCMDMCAHAFGCPRLMSVNTTPSSFYLTHPGRVSRGWTLSSLMAVLTSLLPRGIPSPSSATGITERLAHTSSMLCRFWESELRSLCLRGMCFNH